MEKSLTQLIDRLSTDYVPYQSSEEATKQGIVLPIFRALGWDIFDVRQVIPEFSIGNGRVDYCIKIGEKKVVFIEVKRIGEELDRHEKQILEYSFKYGVDIAVLTNGLIWWLYLPLVGGEWHQRKFLTIDIKQQTTQTAVRHFVEFLSLDKIKTGSALKSAQALHSSKEKETVLKGTIPKAWDKIIRTPDERLVELFADKVESMCGYRPDPEMLAKHISSTIRTVPPPSPIQPPRDRSRDIVRGAARGRGIKIRIDSTTFNATYVSDLYKKVLEFLYDGGYLEAIKSHIPFATSSKRYLISSEPFHPNGNEFRVAIEHRGYYMEAHKSHETAIRALEDLFRLCNLQLQR